MKNPQVGQRVLIYDHYRFGSEPLRGMVQYILRHQDSVEVILLESFDAKFPVGATTVVSRRQLRRDKNPLTGDVMSSQEVEWFVFEGDDEYPSASGSAPNIHIGIDEMMHYVTQYMQDGPVRFKLEQCGVVRMKGSCGQEI